MFEAILTTLGIGTVAYWNRHVFFKFIMIAAFVMIICYVIVISTNIPEKHWPPVFMGGILVTGGFYIAESIFFPPPKPKSMLEGFYDFFFGASSGPSGSDYAAPEVDYSNNPWRNGTISDDSGWGGKRRRARRSK